jgi:hypothetical protein
MFGIFLQIAVCKSSGLLTIKHFTSMDIVGNVGEFLSLYYHTVHKCWELSIYCMSRGTYTVMTVSTFYSDASGASYVCDLIDVY